MTAPRRVLAVVAAVLTALSGVVVATSSPVGAATFEDGAWWSRAVTHDPVSNSPQPLPVEPTTPETVPVGAAADVAAAGQFLVEGTAEGTLSLAALRWRLPDDESSPGLTLPIEDGSVIPPNAIILACRAAVAWTPPETLPGRWESKPTTDPTRCVNGVVSEDGATISFGLQPLVTSQMLDVVLVPGVNPDIPADAGRVDGSTLRWVFSEPGPDALSVVAGSGFREGEGSVFVTPVVTAAGSNGGATLGPSPQPSSSALSLPRTGGVASAPPATNPLIAAPALGADDLGSFVPRDVVPASDATSRDVGVVLLLLAAAAAAWAYFTAPGAETATIGLGRFATPIPASAPSTAVAEPVTGGLGRFAKTRREPPVPLQ